MQSINNEFRYSDGIMLDKTEHDIPLVFDHGQPGAVGLGDLGVLLCQSDELVLGLQLARHAAQRRRVRSRSSNRRAMSPNAFVRGWTMDADAHAGAVAAHAVKERAPRPRARQGSPRRGGHWGSAR